MRRFFIDRKLEVGRSILMTGDEVKHILTVLRMGIGDKILLINDSGTEKEACISSIHDDRSVELEIIGEAPCAAEPDIEVTLIQCIPKTGKLETIIQKCVELGIHLIQPVYSARCVTKPSAGSKSSGDNKLIRFNRVSMEAAKQCGRSIIPKVLSPIPLENCVFDGYDLVLIAYEEMARADDNEKDIIDSSGHNLKEVLNANRDKKRIAIIIGPEGGFEEKEVYSIRKKHGNSYAVSLGKRILRTETAGMAMLAMIMYELEV